jgi:hypothetical protein
MNFRVLRQNPTGAHSPYQVVEQPAGRGVGWINRFLDREYVRRLADKSLYSYAHSLLHFVRWWESVHHTGEISRADLTESTLLDYMVQTVEFFGQILGRPYRIDPARLHALPVQSRTCALRLHHQRPRGLCRSRHPQ